MGVSKYFLTKVKGFFEINIINKEKYMDFLYVFVVFGDLYNDTWGGDKCRAQSAECRVKARGERLFFAVTFILNSIFGVADLHR